MVLTAQSGFTHLRTEENALENDSPKVQVQKVQKWTHETWFTRRYIAD